MNRKIARRVIAKIAKDTIPSPEEFITAIGGIVAK